MILPASFIIRDGISPYTTTLIIRYGKSPFTTNSIV